MIAVIEFFPGLRFVLLMFFGVIALACRCSGVCGFGMVLYNGAIIAEILRAGIVSLPKGQTEAAYAIGLSRTQTLFTILLPQAVRRMLPSLVSQLVVLNKDTSLGFIIGYAELLRRLQLNTQFFGQRYWFQFFVVGSAIYIAVNFTLSRLAVWLERRGSVKARRGYSQAEDVEVTALRHRDATGPEVLTCELGGLRLSTTVIRIWGVGQFLSTCLAICRARTPRQIVTTQAAPCPGLTASSMRRLIDPSWPRASSSSR